jgi:hypothetical protein
LTSCKQGTEVDPTDPYSTKTPTSPSATTKGTADVTITIVKATDLADQWNSLSADVKKKLREKTTLNVAVNNAGYELEGGKIALPNFFAGADNGTTGKIVNLSFNNGFTNAGYNLTNAEYAATGSGDVNEAKKKYLYLNTDALAGNLVNFFFPAGDFDLNLEATLTETTLNSEAGSNIGILTAQAGSSKSALKIKSGVAVKGIALSAGDVKVNGGSLSAQVADATGNYPFVAVGGWNWGAGGFAVGSSEITYVKNLIVDRGVTATVNAGLADYQGTSDAIIIKKNGALVLSDTDPHVGSITGENKNAKVALSGSSSDWSGWNTDMNNIGSFTKVVLTNNLQVKLADTNKFNTVEFKTAVTTSGASYSNVTFNTLNIPVNKDDLTFSFSNVNFKGAVNVTGNYSATTSSSTKTYQWVVDGVGGGSWVEVTTSAPLKAYNATEDVQEFNSTAVDVVAGALTGWNAGAVTSKVIKITYDVKATLNPDNTVIALASDCKVNGSALNGSNINVVFANTTGVTIDKTWFTVTVDGVAYKWKQVSGTSTYILVKP